MNTDALPDPSMATTLRGLLPVPFRRFPAFLREMTARYGNVVAFALPVAFLRFRQRSGAHQRDLGDAAKRVLEIVGYARVAVVARRGTIDQRISAPPADAAHRAAGVSSGTHRRLRAHHGARCRRVCGAAARTARSSTRIEAMTELTLRIATETLFGTDASHSAAVVRDALRLMMNEFPYMLTPLGSLRSRLPLPATRRFWKARAMLDEIVYGLIAERRASASERSDALSLLLAARDAEREDRPSDEQIRDEIMTLFMAGHETTANALTWSLVLLVASSAYRSARGGRRSATATVRISCAWSRKCCGCIRRHGSSDAKRLRDVTLDGGIRIPAQTTVFMAPLLLHRRPDFFTRSRTLRSGSMAGRGAAAVCVHSVWRRRAALHR